MFEKPTIEMVTFEVEDILTNSGCRVESTEIDVD